MSEIRSNLPSVAQYGREAQKSEDDVRQLIKDISKDRTKATQLHRMDLKTLSPAARSLLSQMLAEQLRGQLPPSLAKALNKGTVDPALLATLCGRLANSAAKTGRAGTAATPEAARASASNPNLPQQALQWAKFVQSPTGVKGGGVQGRAGSAAPKGVGTVLQELIGAKLARGEGPGLRSPKLIAKAMRDLSPQQRTTLMNAVFGKNLAGQLQKMGITDPLMFVKAGALPSDRAVLAKALGIPRGRLLGLLIRAEMLKIGPGRNGELPIKPEFLGPLKQAGVAMMATLAAMRGLSFEEMKRLYKKLRDAAGGFKTAVKGGRVPVKRDLIHWARTAARRKSDILLADSEEYDGAMGRDDAMELIQAWYLENLLWDAIEDAKRRARLHKLYQDQERERQRQDRERKQSDDDDPDWVAEEIVPELIYDEDRDDNLMCFWITDESADPTNPGQRRMYVCVDPDTGAIIPQHIEKDSALPT